MDWYSPTRRVLFALLRKQEGKAHSYVIANVQDREGNTKPFPIRAECRGGLTPGNTSGKSRRDTMDAEAGKVCAANSKDHSQDSPEWLMRETPLEKSVHRKVQRTEHREFLKQFHHGLLEVIEGRTLPRQSRISSAQSKTPSSKQPKRYRGRSVADADAVEAEEDVIGNRTNIGNVRRMDNYDRRGTGRAKD
jgi:hypothetical protein